VVWDKCEVDTSTIVTYSCPHSVQLSGRCSHYSKNSVLAPRTRPWQISTSPPLSLHHIHISSRRSIKLSATRARCCLLISQRRIEWTAPREQPWTVHVRSPAVCCVTMTAYDVISSFTLSHQQEVLPSVGTEFFVFCRRTPRHMAETHGIKKYLFCKHWCQTGRTCNNWAVIALCVGGNAFTLIISTTLTAAVCSK